MGALPAVASVILGMSFHPVVGQSSHLKNGDNNGTDPGVPAL